MKTGEKEEGFDPFLRWAEENNLTRNEIKVKRPDDNPNLSIQSQFMEFLKSPRSEQEIKKAFGKKPKMGRERFIQWTMDQLRNRGTLIFKMTRWRGKEKSFYYWIPPGQME